MSRAYLRPQRAPAQPARVTRSTPDRKCRNPIATSARFPARALETWEIIVRNPRPARWAVAALSLATFVMAGCEPALVARHASQTSASPESQALYLLNAERARAGAPPLRLSAGASNVAEGWAATMARDNRLAHNPDLRGALAANGVTGWRIAGENVGYSSAGVEDVHNRFMTSPSHRANILSSGFQEVGVGVVESGGRTWVSLVFVGW